MSNSATSQPNLPPALIAHPRGALILTADGEVEELSRTAAAQALRQVRPLVCHAPATAARLELAHVDGYDLLELFAFVRPAKFCLPTPRGLALALDLPEPANHVDEAMTLLAAATTLLGELGRQDPREARRAATLAATMARGGWGWGPPVLAALGDPGAAGGRRGGLDVWEILPEWAEHADMPAPSQEPVTGPEARERLRNLLGAEAEARPTQGDYAELAAHAFRPRDQYGLPNMVLAEAGTGIGKTLGYVAPASVWAAKNGGAVWLSTYTKNLQRQIDQELDRLYADPAVKANKVVIRKGRENYLCLLNFEEATQGGAARQSELTALGLLARWIGATRDGDMVGGDFPAWLAELAGRGRTLGLTDRRGECIYAGCAHYRKCFIERAVRKARRADIVIANHALVMQQAAHAEDPADLPGRYVFDEGHHLFEAADGAFSAVLSGAEGLELRRWLRGPEGGRRSRGRGLEKRSGDLVADDEEGARLLAEVLTAAMILPGEGFAERLRDNQPHGPMEEFLQLLRTQVLARARDVDSPYGIQCGTAEPVPGLLDAAARLAAALDRLGQPMSQMIKALERLLDQQAETLDSQTRLRIDAAARSLKRRHELVTAWIGMLASLAEGTPPAFADWFALDRENGQETDIAFHRHWIDPMLPFARSLLDQAHGVLVTSATLRDQANATDDGWPAAEARSGAIHIAQEARRASLSSPFDYPTRTKVLIVTDVRRDAPDQIAAAYRELFLASGGGALGLFTAIWRLRAVQQRIAAPLDQAGLPLYAQHVDPIGISTLIDIFRTEIDSCLLGTDAVRDGVDVPGRSLRLIVFDRVPWPRPDILHKARRERFGLTRYDDMLTRLKLKQAFGRLLRRADDRGVFVMLDAQMPTRLLTAFPPDVTVRRVGLAEAIAETREFLSEESASCLPSARRPH